MYIGKRRVRINGSGQTVILYVSLARHEDEPVWYFFGVRPTLTAGTIMLDYDKSQEVPFRTLDQYQTVDGKLVRL